MGPQSARDGLEIHSVFGSNMGSWGIKACFKGFFFVFFFGGPSFGEVLALFWFWDYG